MLERWTRAVLRYRFVVLATWLAVVAVGIWSALQLPDLLSNSFAVPASDSDRAQKLLTRHFGERPDGTFTVVFAVDDPSARAAHARAERRLALAARAVPTGRPGELREGSRLLFAEIDTTLDLKHAEPYTDAIRLALREPGGAPAYVTGQPAIQHDLDPIFDADLRRGEVIAVPLALLVLLGVFGLSLAVAVPFAFAACTITGTLAIVYAIAHVLSPISYVTNLVELIGLGLAIDYSLLIVSRFREECESAGSTDDAIVRTMTTAGRAIVLSGLAVAIGLALLFFVPVPFIRSMGLAGFLIPIVSIAAAVTLQPALLSLLGRRGLGRGLRPRGGFWTRLAAAIMRRPKTFAAVGVTVLAGAAVPVAFLDVTPGSLAGLPRTAESMRGYDLLRDGVGPGAIAPIHVVVDARVPGGAAAGPVQRALDRLGDSLESDGEAYVIATGLEFPYVDETGRYTQMLVAGRHEYGDAATRGLVERLRARHVAAARFPEGVRVYAGGAPGQGHDFLERTYGVFPWLVLAVLALTYVALLRAFRSLLLPLKAVLLNLLTVAAVYGLLVVVFQWGAGQEIEGWIPVFLFAVLFGLSMDYEVFLVTRMREAWDETHDNARAIAQGLERTGRIVTAAALIMVIAFSGFIAGRIDALTQFGFGLAAAVLIDATLVRAILVPSVMAVLGRRSWWLPERIARIARVRP